MNAQPEDDILVDRDGQRVGPLKYHADGLAQYNQGNIRVVYDRPCYVREPGRRSTGQHRGLSGAASPLGAMRSQLTIEGVLLLWCNKACLMCVLRTS